MEHSLMGVGVALVTPFDANNGIDYQGLKNMLDFTSEGGVDYFVVNGTTGESPTTTSSEKSAILKFVKENNTKNLPIVYGIGGNNTAAVLETIQNTDFEGVTAILSVCPYYNKPPQAGLIAHYTAIADASPVPVILYNVPGRTVTKIELHTILTLSEHPNIIGIKDATSSLEFAMELSRLCPKDFLLLSGDDNLVTPLISMGWHGVISVIANGFPKEFSELTWTALKGNYERAAQLQRKFLDFDVLLYVESNPVGIKKCCAIRGLCSDAMRLPLVAASEGLGEKLKAAMIAEGFWHPNHN